MSTQDIQSTIECDGSEHPLVNNLNALTSVFMRVRPHIRKMVENRLDRRLHSRVDASDIVQETFVRASQGLANYARSPKMDPVTWLRLIGKHIVAEIHRHHFRSKRTPERELHFDNDCSELLINRIAESMYSVGAKIDQQELHQRVRAAMQQMSPMDREIIDMRHVDELSMQEAAVALDISLEAAKKRYQRALARFRELTSDFMPII